MLFFYRVFVQENVEYNYSFVLHLVVNFVVEHSGQSNVSWYQRQFYFFRALQRMVVNEVKLMENFVSHALRCYKRYLLDLLYKTAKGSFGRFGEVKFMRIHVANLNSMSPTWEGLCIE